jgi:hypothetical protein
LRGTIQRALALADRALEEADAAAANESSHAWPVASPEVERRIARIRHIQRELQELYRETHPGVTAGTVGI